MGQVPTITHAQAFIDGQFVDAVAGGTFATVSPASGNTVASISLCEAADVDAAALAARAAFESGVWRSDPAGRKATLMRFADLIDEHLEELAALEVLDAGKTWQDCIAGDLPSVSECIRWYAEAIDKIFGKVSTTAQSSLGLIVREPIGVVGAVLPWNFPAAMMSWKIAPALAAGNSVVIKPAEQSPLTALRIAALAKEAGIPDGVYNVVPGTGTGAGKAIGLHPEIDVVAFTGSTEVGRLFLKYAADSNLKRIALELGGKCPQIVMQDVRDELSRVVEDLALAAFTQAGQNCTAGSRILVHATLYDAFVAELVTHTKDNWQYGDPMAKDTAMGPVIDGEAKAKILEHVARAQREGATILCGVDPDNPTADPGNFVPATVIADVDASMAVVRTEIFGPVTCVIPFETEDEAIKIANDTAYGLAATVWAKDVGAAIRMSRSIKAGTVAVNGYSEGDFTTPFGGYRESGFGGRDKGLEAFDQYTELKTIWVAVD